MSGDGGEALNRTHQDDVRCHLIPNPFARADRPFVSCTTNELMLAAAGGLWRIIWISLVDSRYCLWETLHTFVVCVLIYTYTQIHNVSSVVSGAVVALRGLLLSELILWGNGGWHFEWHFE